MLAQQRSRRLPDIRRRESHWVPRRQVLPSDRMLDFDDHISCAQMWVVQHFTAILACATWDASISQNFHPRKLGTLGGPRFEERIDFGHPFEASLRTVIARV